MLCFIRLFNWVFILQFPSCQNIRSGVEKSSFHLPNKEVIKLSVSIGVGYLTDDDPKSQRKVFKDADDMVHVAKNQGRNKVMFNPIINL